MNNENNIIEYKLLLECFHIMKKRGDFRYNFNTDMYSDICVKNLKNAVVCKNKGNKLFMKKKHTSKSHEKIWMYYSASIALAINQSQELADAYANRSLLLMHLRKYKDCMLDIERALRITQKHPLIVKLYCRKAKCLAILKDGKQQNCLLKAKYWLSKIKDEDLSKESCVQLLNKTEAEIMACNNVVCMKDEENKYKEIYFTNDTVEIHYNEKYGRHLITKRNLKPGELVVVEKFYVASMNRNKPYAYCSHCLAISWSVVPCDHCCQQMYCNEKCKEEAWKKYHDIECQMYLNFTLSPIFFNHLSLKSLIMGIREAGSIENLKTMISNIDCTDKRTKGFTNGKFLSDRFQSLYSLNYTYKHTNIKSVELIIIVLRTLIEKANILGNDFDWHGGDYLIKNENALFLGTLLLRLQGIFELNAFEVSNIYSECKKKHDYPTYYHNHCCTRGTGFFPLSSLINHSCDCNVGRCFTNNGKVIYFALKPIKMGSQIFSCYRNCNYEIVSKDERQKLLSYFFDINCDCIACQKNWNPLEVTNIFKYCKIFNDTQAQKFDKLFSNIYKKTYQFVEADFQNIVKDIETLSKMTTRPTITMYLLIVILCLMLEKLHGVVLHIPIKCNSK